MQKSVSSKIAFLFVITISSTLLLLNSIIFINQYNSLNNEMKIDLTNTMKRISNNISKALWDYDKTAISNIIKYEINNKFIERIYIYDNARFLVGYLKDINDKIIEIEKEPDQKNGNSLLNNNLLIEKTADVNYKENVAGKLKIVFSRKVYIDKLKKLFVDFLLQFIVVSVLMVIISMIIINKTIISNLIKLNKTVNEFGNKNFNVRLNINTKDEFEDLSKNFNEMAQTIEEYSNKMEELVEMKTAHLIEANNKLKKLYEQLRKELDMAKKIQLSIIPKSFPKNEKVNFFGFYQPMNDLGGDYYDVFEISENKLFVIIADVCGHGVPAALITTMLKMSVSKYVKENLSPAGIAKKINDELFEIIGNFEYLTSFIAIIDTNKKEITYCNAAHTPIYIINNENEIHKLEINSPIVGFCLNSQFRDSIKEINYSSRIVLYTDGITETRNKSGDFFEKKFEKIILENYDKDAITLISKVRENINSFREDDEQQDDIALLVIDM